ncbi:ATP-binding protein [Amycolatopsis sp. NEAU-NG30]|uniref:ATP-binding protein n=1 Tax=Amycolatopsis melonis TaxID=3156488 RepID=A0ABV0LQC1_9PSEU
MEEERLDEHSATILTTRYFDDPLGRDGIATDRQIGALIGLSQPTITRHRRPTYGPTQDSSGGIAVIGELGAGKSVILNVAAVVRLMLDGRVIVIDRTRSREWAPVATALPGNAQIVDIIDPSLDDRLAAAELRHSCDPLRVFRTAGKSSTGIAKPSSPPGSTWSPTPPSGTPSDAASTTSAASPTHPATDLSTHCASTVDATQRPAP